MEFYCCGTISILIACLAWDIHANNENYPQITSEKPYYTLNIVINLIKL